jgi:F-type H+-transporting ATPase subunit b
MHIDWWTLGLQTINVLVLVWLLGRFLFQPVAAIMAARQAAAQALLRDAAAARDAAEAARQEAASAAQAQAQQRAALLEAAAAEASALKAELEAAARTQADRLAADTAARIAARWQQALQDSGDQAASLAVDIAARLLGRLPPPARVSGFIDGLGAAVAGLDATTLAGLRANSAALRLRAPQALTATELAACRRALAPVLPEGASLTVVVDPGLLAGLELESPHALVHNSLRADLARIKEELLAHDRDPA